jgi:hypothetical protein
MEEHFEIAAEMIDGGGGDVRATGSFGEDESSLKDGLGVQRETLGGPVRLDAVLVDGFGDVRFERGGVIGDAPAAGVADEGMGLVDLLDDGAGEAGEVG